MFRQIIFLFLYGSISYCCFHFPVEYKESLTEGKKEAFVFHDGQYAHLIIRTNMTANVFPNELAWVLPFPSLPVKYEEVDGRFFKELYGLIPEGFRKGDRAGFGRSDKQKEGLGFKVHESVVVGGYQIQPIEILKEKSGQEFNTWLSKNKFNEMPNGNQKYYLKKGAVFLAIRMNTKGLANISIKPLHIVYPSDHVSVPIKFTHDSRTFDLDLYVFAKSPMEPNYRELLKKKSGDEQAYKNPIPRIADLYPSIEKAHLLYEGFVEYPSVKNDMTNVKKILGSVSGYITKFSSKNVNGVNNSVKLLKDDPFFTLDQLLK